TFAEPAKAHVPRAGFFQHLLEIHSEAAYVTSAAPAFAASPALIPVAANKFLLLGFLVDVAETRNVNAIRPVAERHFVFVARHRARSAAAHVMIHDVMTEFAAAVAEAVGKFRRGGI